MGQREAMEVKRKFTFLYSGTISHFLSSKPSHLICPHPWFYFFENIEALREECCHQQFYKFAASGPKCSVLLYNIRTVTLSKANPSVFALNLVALISHRSFTASNEKLFSASSTISFPPTYKHDFVDFAHSLIYSFKGTVHPTLKKFSLGTSLLQKTYISTCLW